MDPNYISPNDLMLGDYVRYKTSKSPHKIFSYKELDGNLTLNFEPLPLTEEILEKNGFMKWSWYKRGQINEVITYSIGDGFNLELKDDGTFELVDNVRDDGDYGYEANYICEVKYVHELQHIMKVLKIKKEIKITQ